ncbi:MAG TPA: hypothetical protein PKE51_08955, partial [Gemmatimonadaceae bacterium]|nr:hypothetical protein [Gemmatimonadaceae bacterium]
MTLHERVQREAQALAWRARGVHTTGTIAVVVAVLALGAWALTDGRWLAWPRAVPLLVWAGALGLALLAWRLITRRVPPPPLDGVAYGIEAEQGLRPGSLRGALEIAANGATGPLGTRAVADVESRLGQATVLLPDARRNAGQRLAIGSAALLVAFAGLGLLSARARDGLAAVLHPLDAYRGLLLEPLAFEALPAEVPRGMPLTVTVRAPGRARVLIARRTAGAAWTVDTVPVDARLGTASLALGALRAPLTLRVDDGRAPTLERDVQVGDRGWIGDLAIEARYPAYLARPDERLDLAAGVRVPRGAVLRVQAATYAGANGVRLVSEHGDTIRFASLGVGDDASAGGVPIEARLDVTRDARWTWSADAAPNARGVSLPVELPEPLTISMTPDAVPTAEVLFPATDTTIAPSGVVRLVLGAADDHGLAEVAMLVSKERADGRREAPVRTLLERTPDPIWEGAVALSLDGRGLEAGDRLVIEVEAVDASPWRQRGRSRALTLRVPSASEQRTLARSLADSLMARADALAEAERALQRSTSEAARSRELQGGGTRSNEPNQSEGARSQSMSYERAEQMRSLAQQQRELGDKVENLQQGARELEQRLDASGALDKAMQERFRELQQMLRDAMTPEMQQRLSELEQNAERLSGSEVRQSLEQLAEQQRQMREQLEKSAEMLKRAALEGAMETLRDEAQELASAERALGEQLKRPSGSRESPTDARAARDLASRSERLQRDVQELTERLQAEGAQAGASKTQEAQPDVQTAREAMQRAAEQLRQEMATAGEQQAGQQQAGQQEGGEQQAG